MNKKITFFLTIVIIGIITFLFLRNKKSKDKITNAIIWDCTSIENNGFKLSNLTQSYSLLQLETNEESLLGSIDKIVYNDKSVYILDKKYTLGIYVFNSLSGEFITKIGKFGNGPGEYTEIFDFSIDNDNQRIYVLCERKRVMTYSLSGDFIEEKTLAFYATAMEYLNNRFYFINDNMKEDNLVITDRNYKTISSHFPNNEYGVNYRVLVHPLIKQNNELIYHRFLDNNIYRIDSIGNVNILYHVDFGNKKINFDEIKEISSNELKQKMSTSRCHIKYIVDNKEYSIILYFDSNTPCLSIYNKANNKAKSYPYNLLKDDLTENKFPLLEYLTPNNQIISILSLEAVENLVENGILNKDIIEKESNPVLYQLQFK